MNTAAPMIRGSLSTAVERYFRQYPEVKSILLPSVADEVDVDTPSFVVDASNPWLKTDINMASDFVKSLEKLIDLTLRGMSQRQSPSTRHIQPIKWGNISGLSDNSVYDPAIAIKVYDTETADFINRCDLKESVNWLQSTAPSVFKGADFELVLLPSDEDDDSMLALKVYCSLDTFEFRNCRHKICEEMPKNGHKKLYDFISIFQRRVPACEWKRFPGYSPLSAE